MLCRESVLSVSSRSSAGRRRPIDPLELYAAAIDTSDYVVRVSPLVRRLVVSAENLIQTVNGVLVG